MHARQQIESSGSTATERRSEGRRAASGTVRLRFESEAPQDIELDLMDISASGFRARHGHGLLPLGANASFHHRDAAGIARVVWNWVQADHVETGFVVIR